MLLQLFAFAKISTVAAYGASDYSDQKCCNSNWAYGITVKKDQVYFDISCKSYQIGQVVKQGEKCDTSVQTVGFLTQLCDTAFAFFLGFTESLFSWKHQTFFQKISSRIQNFNDEQIN